MINCISVPDVVTCMQVLGKGHYIKGLSKCDFTPIYDHMMAEREAKKNIPKEVSCLRAASDLCLWAWVIKACASALAGTAQSCITIFQYISVMS